MKVKKSSSMFVGDRLNDLEAAKKVGVPFTMIRTHGEDPEDDVPVYHSVAEFLAAVLAARLQLRQDHRVQSPVARLPRR